MELKTEKRWMKQGTWGDPVEVDVVVDDSEEWYVPSLKRAIWRNNLKATAAEVVQAEIEEQERYIRSSQDRVMRLKTILRRVSV
jgi:hypothetical protein